MPEAVGGVHLVKAEHGYDVDVPAEHGGEEHGTLLQALEVLLH